MKMSNMATLCVSGVAFFISLFLCAEALDVSPFRIIETILLTISLVFGLALCWVFYNLFRTSTREKLRQEYQRINQLKAEFYALGNTPVNWHKIEPKKVPKGTGRAFITLMGIRVVALKETDDIVVSSEPARPPRFAVAIFDLMMSHQERDDAVGDLHEEFAERCELYGPRAAKGWVWLQLLRSIGPLIGRLLMCWKLADFFHIVQKWLTP